MINFPSLHLSPDFFKEMRYLFILKEFFFGHFYLSKTDENIQVGERVWEEGETKSDRV